MTYIRSKMVNGYGPYYYEVRSVREGKTVRQIHIRYIGKVRPSSSSVLGVVPKQPEATANTYPFDVGHKESRYLYEYHPESQQTIWVAPTRYLMATGKSDFRSSPHFSKDAYERVKKKLEGGEYIDPPMITLRKIPKDARGIVDEVEYKIGYRWYVVEHEGRHRALASRDLGIEQLPTVVFFQDEQGKYTLPPDTLNWSEVSPQSSTINR